MTCSLRHLWTEFQLNQTKMIPTSRRASITRRLLTLVAFCRCSVNSWIYDIMLLLISVCQISTLSNQNDPYLMSFYLIVDFNSPPPCVQSIIEFTIYSFLRLCSEFQLNQIKVIPSYTASIRLVTFTSPSSQGSVQLSSTI